MTSRRQDWLARAKAANISLRHPFTHNSFIPRIDGTSGFKGNGKRSDFLHAFPDRLETRMTVVFAAEKPPKAGNQAQWERSGNLRPF